MPTFYSSPQKAWKFQVMDRERSDALVPDMVAGTWRWTQIEKRCADAHPCAGLNQKGGVKRVKFRRRMLRRLHSDKAYASGSRQIGLSCVIERRNCRPAK